MAITATKEIHSDKIIIKKLFDKDMWYRIPEYQRPYVWDDEQVQNLLDDISYAAQNTPDSQYFLGSIVFHVKMASTDNITYQEYNVLDGQQRLTTLYLIMAVIRDLAKDDVRKRTCSESIYQQANRDDNVPERLRIVFDIRAEVQDFVKEHIKTEGGTLKIDELKNKADKASDISVRNMANAILKIRDWFNNPNNLSIDDFFPYLRNKVLLISVSSNELDDAFRLFTVLNDRGMKLRNSDILKAENLKEVLDESERKDYAKLWEEIESELNDDFDLFLSYIRTILVKEKARLGLLKEFEENIYHPRRFNKETKRFESKPPLLKKGKETFDLIKKYKRHYDELFSGDNKINNSWAFDNLIRVMSDTLAADFWIPPLLAYKNFFGDYRIFDFLIKLDNKFSGDWIAGESPTFRIESMNKIIKRIEDIAVNSNEIKEDKVSKLLASELFKFNQAEFYRQLSGNIYGKRFTKYILYKLDYICGSNNEKKPLLSQLSVEHILPQNPDSKSRWVKDFSIQQREEWTHKLGNLILVSGTKNSSLGRSDYQYKKEKYFKNKIETLAYSIKVLQNNTEWKLNNLTKNHEQAIEALEAHYNVKRSKDEVQGVTNIANKINNGYCIRCKREVPYNPYRPFCLKCYIDWDKKKDQDLQENFCHSCGQEHPSSFKTPLCSNCISKTI